MNMFIKNMVIISVVITIIGGNVVVGGNGHSKPVKEDTIIKEDTAFKKRKREDIIKNKQKKDEQHKKSKKEQVNKAEKVEVNPEEPKQVPQGNENVEEEVKTVGAQALEAFPAQAHEQQQQKTNDISDEALKKCIKTYVLNLVKNTTFDGKTIKQLQEEHKNTVEKLSELSENFDKLVQENKDLRSMVEELKNSEKSSEVIERVIKLESAVGKKWWNPIPSDSLEFFTSTGSCIASYALNGVMVDYIVLYGIALYGTRFVEGVARNLYSMVVSAKKK